MGLLVTFFQKNIKEITQNQALRFYGFFLALTHFFTLLFWTKGLEENKLFKIYNANYAICWPWIENCHFLPNNELIINGIFSAYLGLSLIAVIYFVIRKYVIWGYWILVILTVIKFLIFINDYRFMGNYHYMTFWIYLLYLFVPEKIKTLSLSIVLFYFFAGSLKLNNEWMTSITFINSLNIDQKLTEWLCALVILLELALVWLLLTKSRVYKIIVLLLLLVFHMISLKVVGYFYPAIMFCLDSIFVLAMLFDGSNRKAPTAIHSVIPANGISLVVLGVLILFQFIPYLYQGDSSLTAQGRLFSLNMLDSKSECEDFIYLKYQDYIAEVSRPAEAKYSVRIQCDPLVVFAEAKHYCKIEKQNPNFIDLDIAMVSARQTDSLYQPIFSYKNFCSRGLKIDNLGGLPR